MGTVVVSMSAGRVGVTVSARVVVSADTNDKRLRLTGVAWRCYSDRFSSICLFYRVLMWKFSYIWGGGQEVYM